MSRLLVRGFEKGGGAFGGLAGLIRPAQCGHFLIVQVTLQWRKNAARMYTKCLNAAIFQARIHTDCKKRLGGF